MDALAFRRRYERVWIRLEIALTQRRQHDVLELGHLYQEVSGHLAYARTYFPDHAVTRELNRLVGRAHLYLYGKARGQWRAVGQFFASGFPNAVRSIAGTFLVSYGTMALGALVGLVTVLRQQSTMYALLPGGFVQEFDPAKTGPHAVDAPVMASLIMTHNIEVAILAVLGAFTFGLFTLYTLYQNGLILGALAALYWQTGHSFVFWSLILPHGCIELTAIAIAGAAGLHVGHRWLVPGRLRRMDSLRVAFATAARLVAGVMAMLIVAGTIEGFLTPSFVPTIGKYAFAALTVVLLVAWLGFSGRPERRPNGHADVR
ncbi:MAG: stage II sporulation protein M [Firmicutes bacterium]|nr:stage II sporulation protein M [Bacillota bacterium]